MDNIATELESLERVFNDASAEPIRLSYGFLRSVTNNFSEEIGRGGFGVVYMGYLGNGKVAVKKLSNAYDFSDKAFLDEIKCLIRAKHKNIVRLLGYCSDTQGEVVKFDREYVMAEVQQRLLCFEHIPNGTIQHFLKEKPNGDEWHVRYQMIKGIFYGLQYLHEERISHLDLKLENIMLDARMEPKITDFGLSRVLNEGQSRIITKVIRGTPGYIAPETIDKGEISCKSDIYALGIIIVKLLCGLGNIDFENVIKRNLLWHGSLDVDCPQVKSCIDIAKACLDTDQDNRPTIGEIIEKLNTMENMIEGSCLDADQDNRSATVETIDKLDKMDNIIEDSCLDVDQVNKPTIVEMIDKVDKMENMIEGLPNNERSSMYQMGWKFGKAARKTKNLTDNFWQHLKTGQSIADAAISGVHQITNVIAEGGYEKTFHQTFDAPPEEKLKNQFVCYLYTSAGPIIGVLYLSNVMLAFCSTNPITYTDGDKTECSHYKVAIPLVQLRSVDLSTSATNAAEKNIQVVSVDNQEYRFTGFVYYERAVKCLQEELREARVLQA